MSNEFGVKKFNAIDYLSLNSNTKTKIVKSIRNFAILYPVLHDSFCIEIKNNFQTSAP
jgi:hypothetical protein